MLPLKKWFVLHFTFIICVCVKKKEDNKNYKHSFKPYFEYCMSRNTGSSYKLLLKTFKVQSGSDVRNPSLEGKCCLRKENIKIFYHHKRDIQFFKSSKIQVSK